MIVEKSTAVPTLVTGINPADINTVATTLDGSVLKNVSIAGSAHVLNSIDYPQIKKDSLITQ